MDNYLGSSWIFLRLIFIVLDIYITNAFLSTKYLYAFLAKSGFKSYGI